MPVQKSSHRKRFFGRLILLVIAIAAAGGAGFGWVRYQHRKPPIERYETTGVRRANLFPTLMASGRVESAKRTVIECQLENVAVGVRGQRVYAGGASTLISVVEDGTFVKSGDILAVLDSSDYEELLRVQKISVERAHADRLTAELDHEIARLAVMEFREGTMQETLEDFQRRLTLARSDLERAKDRLNWTHGMKAKGYVSASTVATDEYTVAQADEKLKQEESASLVFQKYSAPKTIRELEGGVQTTAATLQYEQLRSDRQNARLRMLERQVEACTIRAPHDGFVIHANDTRRQIVIEEGMPVRQRQPLFYLPDLKDMEIVAQLHESIVNDVRPGMLARVEVESQPDRDIVGRVKSVSQLPTVDWKSDVRYYDAIVKLEQTPDGLRPGMTAQIEIAMPQRQNVLAVPSEAIGLADGRDVCFVVHDDGLERRDVKLGQVTREMTEVTDGLHEGEQVVLNPRVEESDSLAPVDIEAGPAAPKSEDTTNEVAALH
ncbi:MAG: efflux RND transporter periplasmic adaptor subunit [Isosphaeraceae bacterium]